MKNGFKAGLDITSFLLLQNPLNLLQVFDICFGELIQMLKTQNQDESLSLFNNEHNNHGSGQAVSVNFKENVCLFQVSKIWCYIFKYICRIRSV